MTVQDDELLPVPQCNNNNTNNHFPNNDAEAGEVGNGEETNPNNNEECSQTQSNNNNNNSLSQFPLAKDGNNVNVHNDNVHEEDLEHHRYGEPRQFFGIPWSLFVMLMVLLAAVTVGTVTAVLYSNEPNPNNQATTPTTTLSPTIAVVASSSLVPSVSPSTTTTTLVPNVSAATTAPSPSNS
jgi:hypothetical protein